MSRKKLIALITVWAAILLIAAFLCVFVVKIREKEASDKAFAVKLETELYPLRAEKASLVIEKNDIDRRLIESLGCSAAVGVTLLDLDELFLETFFQAFNSRELPGTLCLSKNELPGLEGKISLERYREIASLGWDTALLFESKTEDTELLAVELYLWLGEMRELLDGLGIEFPRTILFDNVYDLSLDTVLLGFGITVAAHRGAGGLPYVETTAGEGVWHPGMIGWNDTGNASSMLNGVTNTGGYYMYTVGIGEDRLQHDRFIPTRKEHTASVNAMARRLAEGVGLGVIKIMTPEDARAFRTEYIETYYHFLPFAEEKKAEIDVRIAEIDEEIRKIHKKYGY
ncbi:MAG: hypothetical protein IKA64_00435 [Clostridia bacterium]|nr:hypothetical protein [Clostridia bacterium]